MKKLSHLFLSFLFIFFGLFGIAENGYGDVIYSETFGTDATNNISWTNYNGWSNNVTPSITISSGWGVSPKTPCSISGTSGNCNAYTGINGATLIFNFGNISTYTNIILSFNYYNDRAKGNERTITCQISGNGGSTWSNNILASNTTNGWAPTTVVYNISSSYTTNFSIKFTNTNGNTSRIDDIILIGEGEAPKYTVTFNNCDIVEEQTQENVGDAISFSDAQCSEACKLNGWKFLGWYASNKNHNTKVNSPITPVSDTTLYAWYSLGESNIITDTLTQDLIGIEGTTYTDFSNVSQTSSAIYSGQMAGDNNAIQLRIKNSNSGIINTETGGRLSHLKVVWNDNTTNGHALKIYTSDTVYHSPSDLYNRAHCLDSISKGVTDLELDEKPYIGLRSKTGAIFLDTIFITWKNGNDIQYSINPKCFSTPITVAEWFKDSVKFDVGNYDSIHTYRDDLENKSCDSIRIELTRNDSSCIRWFHVPIFADKTTELDKADSICDIVILNGKTFTPQDGDSSKGVYIYPGGTLIVNGAYTVDSLVLRRDNNDVSQFKYNGILNTDKLYFELRTDGTDWRWLTLPDAFTASDMITSNVFVKYYNGDWRASHGSGGWQIVESKSFNAGQGYIFGIDVTPETKKKIYQIELNTSILENEKLSKSVQVYPYGKGTTAPPNDLGWNVIGNPFMDSCYISSENPIRIGQLEPSDTDPWDGKWQVDGTSVKYIVEKDYNDDYASANYYKAVPLTGTIKLAPFTSFFIQVDTSNVMENTYVEFSKTSGIGRAPAKTKQQSEELFVQLNIGNKQTGCFISNKYNDTYEINADLESFDSNLYQLINGYKLIYSAISDSIANNGIHIYGHGDVNLNEETDVNRFSELSILYNNNYYNLLQRETVSVDGEFVLFAKRKNNTATNLEVPEYNSIMKILYNNRIYIIKNNNIYNILGNKLR